MAHRKITQNESHRYPKLSPPPARFVSRVREATPPAARWKSKLPPQFPSHWRRIPPGAENARGIGCQDAKAMVWYFPYGDTVYDVSGRSVATIDLCFDSIEEARRFFDTIVASGDIEAAELRADDGGKSSRGRLIDVFPAEDAGVRETGHRVADFNTLDDLLTHARQEGATRYLQIDDETHIYFQRRDGSYEKAEAWQKDGYWHTQAPGSRAIVRKPPQGAKPIEGTHAAEDHRERSLDRLYGHTRGRDPYPFPSDRDRGISKLYGPKSGGAGAPTLMRPKSNPSRSAHHHPGRLRTKR